MNQFAPSSGTSTHPSKSARIEAISVGWNQGKSGSITLPKPDPIDKKPKDNVITKTTTSVQIVYLGDDYGCNLPITITIGNKTFTPTGDTFQVSGIAYGEQGYQIQGQINCQTIGGCNAYGQGTINVTEDATFYIRWQNVAFSQCKVWLQAR